MYSLGHTLAQLQHLLSPRPIHRTVADKNSHHLHILQCFHCLCVRLICYQSQSRSRSYNYNLTLDLFPNGHSLASKPTMMVPYIVALNMLVHAELYLRAHTRPLRVGLGMSQEKEYLLPSIA